MGLYVTQCAKVEYLILWIVVDESGVIGIVVYLHSLLWLTWLFKVYASFVLE